MAQQNINVGLSPMDGTGDNLRDSQIKANSNFTELYTNKVDKVSGKDLSSNDYTDAEKTKLQGIEDGAQVNVPTLWTDIIGAPPSTYASVGYFQHNDLATQTTPISITAGVETKLTNDTLGAYTNLTQAPYTVSDDWDSLTNSFNFSQMNVGDTIDLRVNLSLTTTTTNTNYKIILRVGEGTAFEYDINVFSGDRKLAETDIPIIGDIGFSLDYQEHIDNPASLYIICDKNASVKVIGWYSRILLKNINLVNFDDSNLKRKTESLKYTDNLLTGSDALIELQPDGSSYYDFTNSGLVSIKGFSFSLLDVAPSPQYPYEGKDFIIKNSTGIDITLKENIISGTEIPFKLKGSADIVVPNGEAIWFKTVNGIVEAEEIMRSFGSGTPQDLQSVVDVDGNVLNSLITLETEGDDSIVFKTLGVKKGNIFHNTDGVVYTSTAGDEGTTYMKNGAIVSTINNLLPSYKKNAFNFLESGLKISSRSDGSEIGVIINTDNLPSDIDVQFGVGGGTVAYTSDIENLTASEVKTLYESNPNTNEFDDLEKAKLASLSGTVYSDSVYKAINPLLRLSNNLSNNEAFIQNGSYNKDTGAYVASTSYISLGKQPITGGKTITVSGLSTIGSTIGRICFFDASNVFISSFSGAPYKDEPPFTVTTPIGTATYAITVASGSGIGTSPSTSKYIKQVMVSEGSDIKTFEPYLYYYPNGVRDVYVSTTGNDTTGDGTINKPYATVLTALNTLKWLDGNIILRGGDYYDQELYTTTYSNTVKLKNYKEEIVRIINGIRVTTATLEPTYTKVYKATSPITLPSGTFECWQHDINDVNSIILDADRIFEDGEKTHRLSSTRIYKATSLADIEASSIPKWFNIGTDFYFSKVSGSDISVNPIVVPQSTLYTDAFSEISNITFLYRNFGIRKTIKFTKVKNGFTNVDCFQAVALSNVIADRCEGFGCHNDGFGYAFTAIGSEIDVYAYDNLDEGSSSHETTKVQRLRGFYRFNTNGTTDVGSSQVKMTDCVVTKNTGNAITFTHTSVSGTDKGNAMLVGVVTDGSILATVLGRVKAYNCKALGTISTNITQI